MYALLSFEQMKIYVLRDKISSGKEQYIFSYECAFNYNKAAEKKERNVLNWKVTDEENFVFEQMYFGLPEKRNNDDKSKEQKGKKGAYFMRMWNAWQRFSDIILALSLAGYRKSLKSVLIWAICLVSVYFWLFSLWFDLASSFQ